MIWGFVTITCSSRDLACMRAFMSCFRCGFMIQTCVSKRFGDLLRIGVFVQVLLFTVSFVQDQSTGPGTSRLILSLILFPFFSSGQSTGSGTSRPTQEPVDRLRNQSTDPGTFSCFDFGLSSCFPRLFYWFLSMFSRIMPYLFYTGDGEWLVYRMWLGGAFTFKFFTLCCAFPGTTPRIPSVHEHSLRVPPLQDRTRCIASLIHQISSCHYDFKALADSVCNV